MCVFERARLGETFVIINMAFVFLFFIINITLSQVCHSQTCYKVRTSPGTIWAEPSRAGRRPGWIWRFGISPANRWDTWAAPSVPRCSAPLCRPTRRPPRTTLCCHPRCPLPFPVAVRFRLCVTQAKRLKEILTSNLWGRTTSILSAPWPPTNAADASR